MDAELKNIISSHYCSIQESSRAQTPLCETLPYNQLTNQTCFSMKKRKYMLITLLQHQGSIILDNEKCGSVISFLYCY